MSEQTKVLTVTFGTFSCTLQGFDDPFPVLKQIADYFQDLAHRDPMFGTRTGTVSPETLAIIASMTGGTAETLGGKDISVTAADPAAVAAPVVGFAEAKPVIDLSPSVAEAVEEAGLAMPAADEVAEHLIPEESAPEVEAAVEDDTGVEETASEDPVAIEADTIVAESDQDAPVEEMTAEAEIEAETAPQNLESNDLEIDTPDDAPMAFVEAEADDELADDADQEDTPEEDVHASLAALLDTDAPEAIAEDAQTADETVEEELTNAIAAALEDDTPEADAEAEIDIFGAHEEEGVASSDDALPVWEEELAGEDVIEEAPVAAEPMPEPVMPEPAMPAPAAMPAPVTPMDSPVSDYSQRTVMLSFGETPGLNQTRDLAASVPPPPPALDTTALFEGTDETSGFDLRAFSEFEPSNAPAKEVAETSEPVAPIEPVAPTETVAPPQPAAEEPAPLVLTDAMSVEEQRAAETVDQNPTADGPVLRLVEPVTAKEALEDGDASTLRDFAERAGAATLPDLLEASAAFVTLVNGRPSFTRGEIMRMVDSFSEDGAFSQEARIKSFGALIRGGRIHRTDTGDFEISRAARAAYENAG